MYDISKMVRRWIRKYLLHSIFSRHFFDFSEFFYRILLNKGLTSQKTFTCLKASRFSMPPNDVYNSNWETVRTMSIAMSFDASFDCERFFLMCFFAKNCQILGLLNLCRLFQKLFIQLHQQ